MTVQTGPYPQSPTDEAVINLGLGQPSPSLLPLAELATAAQFRLAAGGDPLVLQYGVVRGHAGFRSLLAGVLARETNVDVSAAELSLTGGTSLGLSLVAQSLSRAGDTVACGDPTYFLARRIFDANGLGLAGIPVDADGMDVGALERALGNGLSISFAYVIPAFHNPCGVTLAPERAERLVELAARYDFYIVADEPYTLLHFAGCPPSMMQYDRGRGRVLSLGSFSKILGPGLRLGWIHAAPVLHERLAAHGVLESGGCPNPVVASIVQATLEDGFLSAHVARLRTTFRARAAALCGALDELLPQLIYTRPNGGYFVWGRAPDIADTTRLLATAQNQHHVTFTPGARCAISRDLSDCFRFSFAFYTEPELREGVRRLASAVGEQSAGQ